MGRGCIVGPDLSVLSLVIVKKGEGEIPGLTDVAPQPRRRGPKRASNIRKLFNLDKKDNVTAYVVRREITKEGKKSSFKAPKIQRLITPERLQHKRQAKALKRKRTARTKVEAHNFMQLVNKRLKQAKDRKILIKQRKRSASASAAQTA